MKLTPKVLLRTPCTAFTGNEDCISVCATVPPTRGEHSPMQSYTSPLNGKVGGVLHDAVRTFQTPTNRIWNLLRFQHTSFSRLGRGSLYA
jgi:hypothetical protein